MKPRFPVFNESVNFEKQCIFIAIPKTGTTSVRSQLRQEGDAFIPNPHLDIVQVRDALYVFFLANALGRNRTFPTASVPTDAELRGKAADVFQTFFKFSAVRNPWARAVSLYARREGVPVSDRLSFEAFCRQHFHASDTCRQPTLHRNQLDWLCDEDGRLAVDYVYRLEDFEEAIGEIERRTRGRVTLARRTENRNPASRSLSYRDVHTQETREIIAKRFEKDIDYFRYAF